MPKSKKQKNINLIPQDEFESSTAGRILKWALSSFRMIVIATELVVISAFLSRFWLDARNSDLNEELEISKAQVGAYADIETEFRKYQKKLSIVKSLYAEPKSSETMNTLSKMIPTEVSLSSVSISEGLLQIKASAFSENSIAQFLINLEGSNTFNNVVLSQISNSIDNANLTLFTIKGEKGDKLPI